MDFPPLENFFKLSTPKVNTVNQSLPDHFSPPDVAADILIPESEDILIPDFEDLGASEDEDIYCPQDEEASHSPQAREDPQDQEENRYQDQKDSLDHDDQESLLLPDDNDDNYTDEPFYIPGLLKKMEEDISVTDGWTH